MIKKRDVVRVSIVEDGIKAMHASWENVTYWLVFF